METLSLQERVRNILLAFREDFAKINGVDIQTLETIRATLGEGMKKGTVSFAPGDGKDGVFGSLHFLTKKENLLVRENKPITNDGEAAFLTGLQAEVDKEKATR